MTSRDMLYVAKAAFWAASALFMLSMSDLSCSTQNYLKAVTPRSAAK